MIALIVAAVVIILLAVALAMAGIYAMYQASVWFKER